MDKYSSKKLVGLFITTLFVFGMTTRVLAAEDVTSNPEVVLWSVVQKNNSIESYTAYLAKFTNGNFVELANAAIKRIKTENAVREENTRWKVVQDSEIATLIQEFLDKYPKGSNISAAKLKLATIHKIETEYKPGQTFKGCVNCPELVIVSAGNFLMGETNNSHRVTFSNPFAIGKKEVTQKEWLAVMGSNPSKFKDCLGNCPVDNISWNDAKEYIRRLNIKTGKEYRLPSEAEWEYSCRAGEQLSFCGSNDANSVAWYGIYSTPENISLRSSKPVATKKANAWGIFDMSGNVAEWTEDGYHENFTGAPTDGSAWQGDGQGYVIRGGSWEGNLEQIRATSRNYDGPSNSDITYGFRVARKFP
jgi:formylglycine-generating enzyme required for sulfatase activity